MGMIYCRGCGKEIHDSALSCPNCGATQQAPQTQRGDVSKGLLVAGYLCAVLLPIAGIIIGIITLVKGVIGHGITIIGVSLFMWVVIFSAIL